MAKIANLAVQEIKIKNGSLTKFVHGGSTSITVANDGGNPTFLWLENSSGGIVLKRSRDGAVIFEGSGYLRAVAADASHQSSETYSVNRGIIRGASFRWR